MLVVVVQTEFHSVSVFTAVILKDK